VLANGNVGCYFETALDQAGFQVPKFYPAAYSTTAPSQVTYEVRHVKDPFVVASRLTNGKYNFGLTQAEQAGVGLTLIVIGAVMCGIVILAVTYIFKMFKFCFGGSEPAKTVQPYAYPAVQSTQPMQPSIQGQPMIYAQQPVAYQQQQPNVVYVQAPQPQPQVMYAQQPQMYAPQQPQVVYAQQAPNVVYAQQAPNIVYAQAPIQQQPGPSVIYAQAPTASPEKSDPSGPRFNMA
jgi:hypothetical protein